MPLESRGGRLWEAPIPPSRPYGGPLLGGPKAQNKITNARRTANAHRQPAQAIAMPDKVFVEPDAQQPALMDYLNKHAVAVAASRS